MPPVTSGSVAVGDGQPLVGVGEHPAAVAWRCRPAPPRSGRDRARRSRCPPRRRRWRAPRCGPRTRPRRAPCPQAPSAHRRDPSRARCDNLFACTRMAASARAERPRTAPSPCGSGWPAPPCTSTRPAASVLGLLIVLAAFEGEAVTALWLGLAALFIDGTDGMLARRFRVKETIPWFDGALLDNIVDYLTYVFAPIVLLWTTDHLPDGAARLGASPRCRCWPRATSSAGSTRRPPTTSSWASRATGTSSPSTRSCSTSAPTGVGDRARRLRRAGVRAGPLPLPVAHDGCCAALDAGAHAVWAGHLRGAAAAVPRPEPAWSSRCRWPTSSTTSG